MTTPRDTEAEQDDSPQDSTPESARDSTHGTAQDDAAAPDAEEVKRAYASAEPTSAQQTPRDADTGPGWASREQPQRSSSPAAGQEATTVLPGGTRRATAARPPAAGARTASRPLAARSRRARLTLRRIDPWSVFLFSLVASVFIGLAMVVAVAVMYAVLGSLGVTESLNELYAEVTGGDINSDALLTSSRIIGGAAVLAAINVVFLTLLATLGALLYNLCSSFTGGLELTFGERD